MTCLGGVVTQSVEWLTCSQSRVSLPVGHSCAVISGASYSDLESKVKIAGMHRA